MGAVSSPPPAETSAEVALPCFDRTGSVPAILHMQALWQRQLRKGCSRQQGGLSAAEDDHRQQRGTRYGCDIWSGGADYSAVERFRGGTVHAVTVQNIQHELTKHDQEGWPFSI